ncbi:interferon-induced protein with tetratricopeptide repeats 1B isoform X2 [Oryzias melastigma]|uniref:interferon-induced protein with tetratricopeptide repeats 1B isoform X2 n=1 Tax=Oryzias melastigma TaxID=30732 RepID=UPI000CF7FBB0|nr:interferon-induced protein with tetratricopeptide repeats 1B isoform X2 [Oryzias melastigma]
MSSSSQTPSELEALECHFTWVKEFTRSELLHMKVKLEDIGTDEGNFWLGSIYNMWGFVLYKLDSSEEALQFLNKATETLKRLREEDEGPWLVVNYGNLAWLHHHLGEEAKCQDYLSKVGALKSKFPSPSQDELHPEIYAEKAWTLMKFDKEKKQLAADYFQRAFNMQPDVVQWQSSRVIALASAAKHWYTDLSDDLLQEIRTAREQDPENLYVAAVELRLRKRKGETVEDEAETLGQKILLQPVNSYSGLKPLLRLHRQQGSLDEAIVLTEEALQRHPNERYLKRCAALCYKWKVLGFWGDQADQRTIERAIQLLKEVINLYPDTSFPKKVDLADVQAKSCQDHAKADQMYQDLLKMENLDSGDKQLLYYSYARYLYFKCQDSNKSIRYHMMAAEIQPRDFYGKLSVKELKKICERGRNGMCTEIREFLENLPDDDSD